MIKAEKKHLKAGEELSNLYKLAPEIVARKRRIKSKKTIQKIIAMAELRVQEDWNLDPDSRKQYAFHFVSSYVYCHVDSGLMTELEGDRLMDIVVGGLDIFID
ncbi:MAG: hypothetical protein ACFHVJ_11250 [Aestuariibacter sp.]